MAKKKNQETSQPAPTPPKKEIGRAEAFFIEANFGKRHAKDVAADIGLEEQQVQAYFEEMDRQGVEPQHDTKPQTRVEKAGYIQQGGAVMATQTAAMLADEMQGTSPFADKQPQQKDAVRYPRVKNGDIHVIPNANRK